MSLYGNCQINVLPKLEYDRRANIPYMDSMVRVGRNQLNFVNKLPRSAKHDSLKLQRIYFLGTVYRIFYGRKDTLLIYANELMNLGKEWNQKSFMLEGYAFAEHYYRVVKSNLYEAIKINNNGLKYCTDEKADYVHIQRFKGNLANLYYELGKYETSLTMYFETLPLIARNPDIVRQNMQYAGVYQGISGNYRKLNKLKEAEQYLIKALEKAKKYDTGSSQAWLLGDLGYIYKEMGRYEEALNTYKQAEVFWKKFNITQAYSGVWLNTAEVYLLQKRYDEAIEYANKALNTKFNVPTFEENAYLTLYKSYKAKNDWENAFANYEKFNLLHEEAQVRRKEKDALTLQIQFDKERLESENLKQLQIQQQRVITLEKQAEIDKLKTESEKNLLSQKAKNVELFRLSETQRLKNQSTQLQSKQDLIIRNLKINELNQTLNGNSRTARMSIIISILALLLGGGLIWFFQNQNKQNRFILQKEVEMREKEAIFQQKIAETEITALRSQMNPHFIFNCLNSIKLYTLENDSRSASDYLTKFSRLIRLVLENSRSEKVTLENELETLKLYIEMEAMRFKEKVKYEIKINKDIDQQFIEIPPLLIQPFVENAIWHGLMHKPEGGKVSIAISQNAENKLHVEITDDGVGREKAIQYKSKSAMRQKSYGMKVTSERIELINQMYKTNTEVQIFDLKDKNQIGIGTKVILNIPI